jgi:hypothetical protein
VAGSLAKEAQVAAARPLVHGAVDEVEVFRRIRMEGVIRVVVMAEAEMQLRRSRSPQKRNDVR